MARRVDPRRLRTPRGTAESNTPGQHHDPLADLARELPPSSPQSHGYQPAQFNADNTAPLEASANSFDTWGSIFIICGILSGAAGIFSLFVGFTGEEAGFYYAIPFIVSFLNAILWRTILLAGAVTMRSMDESITLQKAQNELLQQLIRQTNRNESNE